MKGRRRNRDKGATSAQPTEKELQSAIAKRSKFRKLSALQQRMQKRVDSGKFRMLNESMYTTTGTNSLKLMKENPHLFQVYHAGFSEQVKRWPRNPLEDIINHLSARKGKLRIADLGCGEARLASQLQQHDVKSFDLIALNDSVIECDIAHVPLPDSAVDVAVFCLSLMGTNYGDYIREARRIIVPKGLMLIAEVASRFEGQDPKQFVTGVEASGFRELSSHPLVQADLAAQTSVKRKRGGIRKGRAQKVSANEPAVDTTAFFFKFAFKSTKREVAGDSGNQKDSKKLPALAACVYKKR